MQNTPHYSQLKAFKSLLVASIKSMLKSPTAVIFSFAFPMVFILAFSFLDPNNVKTFNIALSPESSTTLTEILSQNPNLKIIETRQADSAQLYHLFKSRQIEALVDVRDNTTQTAITIQQTILDDKQSNLLNALLAQSLEHTSTSIKQAPEAKIASLKRIDFILPSQLGFALLASSVFGTAFLFFNLRQNLVLKRFLTTPVRPLNIILAECTARIIIQILSTASIILIGYFWMDYTLINGWVTFTYILLFSIFSLFTFLSYGFIISGISKSEATIPPLANIVTLPQFILAGTFFPVESLPKWLQWIANIMPLTHYNNAIRSIAFEGTGLWDNGTELLILTAWGIVSIAVALKVFKWE